MNARYYIVWKGSENKIRINNDILRKSSSLLKKRDINEMLAAYFYYNEPKFAIWKFVSPGIIE